MSIKEYEVKQILNLNGVEVHPGEKVGIEEKSAKVLVDLGVVAPTGNDFNMGSGSVSDIPPSGNVPPPEGDA